MADLLAVVLFDSACSLIPRPLSMAPALLGLLLSTLVPGVDAERMPALDVEQAQALGTAVLGALLGLGVSQIAIWTRLVPRSYAMAATLEQRLDEKHGRSLEIATKQGLDPQAMTDEEWDRIEALLPSELAAVEPPEYRHRREMALEALYLSGPILGAVAAGLFWPAPHFVTQPWCRGLLGSALGLLVGGGFQWYIRILFTSALDRVALGLGDVRLMAGVGAMLGWFSATLGFFMAPVLAVPFLLASRLFRLGKPVPFGPGLCLGSFTAMLVGEQLWNGWGFSATIATLQQMFQMLLPGGVGAHTEPYDRWLLLLVLAGLSLFILGAGILGLLDHLLRER